MTWIEVSSRSDKQRGPNLASSFPLVVAVIEVAA